MLFENFNTLIKTKILSYLAIDDIVLSMRRIKSYSESTKHNLLWKEIFKKTFPLDFLDENKNPEFAFKAQRKKCLDIAQNFVNFENEENNKEFTKLFNAALCGDIHKINQAHYKEICPINVARHHDTETIKQKLITIAIANGHLDLLPMLFDSFYAEALRLSIAYKHYQVAEKLLQTNKISAGPINFQFTAYVTLKNVLAVELLLKFAGEKIELIIKECLCGTAIQQGDLDIVESILKHSSLHPLSDTFVNKLFFVAAYKNNNKFLNILLKHATNQMNADLRYDVLRILWINDNHEGIKHILKIVGYQLNPQQINNLFILSIPSETEKFSQQKIEQNFNTALAYFERFKESITLSIKKYSLYKSVFWGDEKMTTLLIESIPLNEIKNQDILHYVGTAIKQHHKEIVGTLLKFFSEQIPKNFIDSLLLSNKINSEIKEVILHHSLCKNDILIKDINSLSSLNPEQSTVLLFQKELKDSTHSFATPENKLDKDNKNKNKKSILGLGHKTI